jgi:hypothetical protein
VRSKAVPYQVDSLPLGRLRPIQKKSSKAAHNDPTKERSKKSEDREKPVLKIYYRQLFVCSMTIEKPF